MIGLDTNSLNFADAQQPLTAGAPLNSLSHTFGVPAPSWREPQSSVRPTACHLLSKEGLRGFYEIKSFLIPIGSFGKEDSPAVRGKCRAATKGDGHSKWLSAKLTEDCFCRRQSRKEYEIEKSPGCRSSRRIFQRSMKD